MAKVVLSHVGKRYGDLAAIADLSMEIRDKEFFALLGPSGSGKSTVLRLIAGLEQPTSGEIYIGDDLVNDLKPFERAVAMAFEAPSYGLHPHLSAYDNMAFGLRFGRSRGRGETTRADGSPRQRGGRPEDEGEIRKRIEQVADTLGLGSYLRRRQSQLSAGHSQAVALGRAVTRKPRVFLLDDPLSQVDSGLRAKSRLQLRQVHREREATIVYVTHDQGEAMALASRIAVMKEGVVQQVATPQVLYERPANLFVATFIGMPPMNLFELEVVSTCEGISLRSPGGLEPPAIRIHLAPHVAQRLSGLAGRLVAVGVRPEHIRDATHEVAAGREELIAADVEYTEFMGHEIYGHLRAGGHRFVARLGAGRAIQPGDRLHLSFDADSIHAFEPRTQQTLL